MRVFYICGYANDVYYVMAEDKVEAEQHLRDQLGKHLFKNKLKDGNTNPPPTLGDRIIIEQGITEEFLENTCHVNDITAAAYMFAKAGKPYWVDWDLSEHDVLLDPDLAEGTFQCRT